MVSLFAYVCGFSDAAIAHSTNGGVLALSAQAMARRTSAGYNSLVSLSPQTARVKVLFFGRLKEIVGHAEDSVELPDGAPIEALFAHYGASHPELARFRASLVASRNQEFAAWGTPLHSGDEVAFLPPVSGG
jgi:molybdopterin synthase sulfur carrier subunit